MFIPPSNKITASATDTMFSTAANDRPPSCGQMSDAAAAAMRKNAGAGIRSRSLSRLDITAATPASAMSSTIRLDDPRLTGHPDLSLSPQASGLAYPALAAPVSGAASGTWPAVFPR